MKTRSQPNIHAENRDQAPGNARVCYERDFFAIGIYARTPPACAQADFVAAGVVVELTVMLE